MITCVRKWRAYQCNDTPETLSGEKNRCYSRCAIGDKMVKSTIGKSSDLNFKRVASPRSIKASMRRRQR
eukprot:6187093-Pleurochrysis_carterae.AAC.1